MAVQINLLQLNIESNKHLDQVTNFLSKRKPEVTCIQELFESDISLLEKALGATCHYAPMKRRMVDGVSQIEGVGIFSRLPVRTSSKEYYVGLDLPDEYFDVTDIESRNRTQSHVVLWCEVEKENTIFKVGTTHFVWTPDGEPDEFQCRALNKLMPILKKEGEFLLCGDFNAPRGKEIFTALAQEFTDNIPAEYTTSIDGTLHRAGPIELMVDGIFSTKNVRVTNVERLSGVSDHCAFVANVEVQH